ncbi:MAG: lipopolysaccharide biosynthesis protein [Pyrinomonadaceae bacterium]
MAEAERKKRSLTEQSAWILIAKVFGFVLNTALPLLVVRYLTQENVGVYRQAFLVAANAVLVLPLGFSMSAYYFLNRDPGKRSATVLNILIFNFVMGAAAFVVLLSFPQILGAAFTSPELERLAPLIGIVIWLWIFSGFLETAALALQEARLAAGFIVLSQLVKTLFMIIAVVAYENVDSLIFAAIIVFAVQSLVLVAYLKDRFPRFWKDFDPKFFQKQLAYALPFGLSVLLYVIQTDAHNYFVSHSFSAAEFAIYSVGCFQLPLIALLYESVGSVMIPRMSEMQDAGQKHEMLEMTVAATQKLAFFYFPLFCFLMIVAGEFITTLFTREYAASTTIFRVNLLALPLFSLVVDPIMRAFAQAGRLLLKIRVAIGATLFIIFWLGIGRFGLIEMISIVVAAILIEKLVCAWLSIKMLEACPADIALLKTTGKIALAACAAAAVLLCVYLVGAERLMDASMVISRGVLGRLDLAKAAEFVGGCIFLGTCFAIYATSYLAAAGLLGAIDADDKERVRNLLRRVFPRRAAEHTAA